MQTWKELLSIALIGTEQQTLTRPSGHRSLDSILNQLDLSDRERAVLSAAGVMALWQKAGYQAAADHQPSLLPCEPDTLPRCSAKAGQHLALMLQGQYRDALPEWLAAVTRASRRAPEEHMPRLLELGAARPELRLQLLPVLGQRGAWLAAQNSAWRYAAYQSAEVTWETSSHDERLFLLQRLRAENSGRARDLLASTWSQEGAKERAAYLVTFRTGLSLADEPFLENLLDDRSKEVRHVVADLLASLPESRLTQRTIERAKSLLSFKPGRLLGRDQLEVALPETCDQAALRDGLEPRPPIHLKETGEKAWQLQQLLSIIPPSYWSQTWRKTPLDIVQTVQRNKWQRLLLEGWAVAAQRHKDADWAEVLLAESKPDTVVGLLKILPSNRREAYALGLLRSERQPLKDDKLTLDILQCCQPTWSVELTGVVLAKIRQLIADITPADRPNYWRLEASLADLAHHIPPALLDEVAAADWPKHTSGWLQWEKPLEAFLAVVSFRQNMLKAFEN